MRQNHLISTSHLSREDIEAVFDHATDIDVDPTAFRRRHAGRILGLCFLEPSTRTQMSFDSAMKRLGDQTVNMGPVESSSTRKGETLADTVRMVGGYADAFVLRHPSEGTATMAAEFVDVPLVNTGDGAGQHPNQTPPDLCTIRENAGLDDLTIGIMDSLKYGRTIHSLVEALTNFDASQHFVNPESLRLPRNVRYDLHASGAQVREHTELGEVLPELDVFYVTHTQRERFPSENEYREAAGQYQIDSETLNAATNDFTIIHPLSHVDETSPDIGDTDHVMYFEQARNGVPVRMTLLDILLSQDR